MPSALDSFSPPEPSAHRPRVQRYARGRSPETYYRDSYDDAALAARMLEPFRAGRPFVTAVLTSRPMPRCRLRRETAGPEALLVVDGTFLQRPELRGHWDAVFFVQVPFEVSVPRGNARFPGTPDVDPLSDANRRYVDGQRLYLHEARPAERATWVVDNSDLDRPVLRHCEDEDNLRH